MILISNPSAATLANAIAKANGYELKVSTMSTYSGAEVEISISYIESKECVLVIGMSKDSNQTFVELLLHLSTLKNMGVERIHLCLPYLIYSRQYNSSTGPRGVLKAILDVVNIYKLASVQLIDDHGSGIVGHIKRSTEVSHYDLFSEHISRSLLIVAPDRGSKRRTDVYATHGYVTGVLEKARSEGQEISINGVREEFYRKDCIIIDDIVDSASTICRAAEFLKESGAERIGACISHNVLNAQSVAKIEASPLDYLVLSDTNVAEPFVLECKKIKIVSAAGVIARHLQAVI